MVVVIRLIASPNKSTKTVDKVQMYPIYQAMNSRRVHRELMGRLIDRLVDDRVQGI